jgi:hypothetical protein
MKRILAVLSVASLMALGCTNAPTSPLLDRVDLTPRLDCGSTENNSNNPPATAGSCNNTNNNTNNNNTNNNNTNNNNTNNNPPATSGN